MYLFLVVGCSAAHNNLRSLLQFILYTLSIKKPPAESDLAGTS